MRALKDVSYKNALCDVLEPLNGVAILAVPRLKRLCSGHRADEQIPRESRPQRHSCAHRLAARRIASGASTNLRW